MVLRQGDRGDEVKTLQRGLNKLGEMLLIDGHFGGGTRDAVVGARAAAFVLGHIERAGERS